MKRKSISPVIATVLLVIVTVSVTALVYIWTTGMFTHLTTQAEQQTGEVGSINFDLIYAIHDNNVTFSGKNYSTFNITLLNSGKVSLNFNRSGIFINVEYVQKPRGIKVSSTCDILDITNLTDIKPGETAVLSINCTNFNDLNRINPDLYRYTITINYLGIVRSITYG